MDYFADLITTTVILLVLHGAVFGILAVAVKRRAVVDAAQRSRPEFVTNLWLALINSILIAPLLVAPTQSLHAFIGTSAALQTFWEGVNGGLAVLAAIFLIDFTAYWRHRLEHEPALWRFHATHHSDTAMHWLSVQRKHPVAKLLSVIVDTLPAVALGLPVWAIGGGLMIRGFWGYFIHADVPWTFDRVGKVLMSPAAHRLHHIRDERLMGSNYANTFSFIDVMFGTYRDPAPYRDCETGIAEGTRTIWGELVRPWEARYRKRKAFEATERGAES